MKHIKILWILTIINCIIVGLIFILFLTTPISILSGSYDEEYYNSIKEFINDNNKNQQKWIKEVLVENQKYTDEAIDNLYKNSNLKK